MTDDQLLELINADLDGELSPDDQQLLAEIRAERPEAVQLHDELQQVIDKVQSLRAVDPPAHLKNRILAALPQEAAPARREEGLLSGFIDSVRTLFQPRYALQLATIFAGGLVVGMVLMRAGALSNPVDPTAATGTIGASQNAANTVTATLQQSGGEAAIQVVRSGDQIIVRVDGTVRSPIDFEIRVAPELASFSGFAQDAAGAGTQFTAESGVASIGFSESGVASVTFAIAGSGQGEIPISVSLSSEGEETVSRDLVI